MHLRTALTLLLLAGCHPRPAPPTGDAPVPTVTLSIPLPSPSLARSLEIVDAAPPETRVVPAPCACAHHAIEWGGTPGLYDFVTYKLAPCRTLTSTSAKWVCRGTASCDTSSDGGADGIEQVLAHPDVVAALARAPVRFGRPYELAEGGDGYRIVVDQKEIVAYRACAHATAGDRCEPAPPGVVAAIDYLRNHVAVAEPMKCDQRH